MVTSVRLDRATRKYAVGTERTTPDPTLDPRSAELEAPYDIVVFAAPLQATPDPLASSRANRTSAADLFDPGTIPQFRDLLDRGAGHLPAYRRCVTTLVQGRMRQGLGFARKARFIPRCARVRIASNFARKMAGSPYTRREIRNPNNKGFFFDQTMISTNPPAAFAG